MARSNKELYEAITDKVVTMLENGKIPWHKPWQVDSNGNPNLPMNYTTKKAYRGVNIWLLSYAPFSSPYWMTFKQCSERGGTIRKGEKATEIFFYSFIKKGMKDENGKPVVNDKGEEVKKQVPLLKSYFVFNYEQTDGLPAHESKLIEKPEEKKFDKIDVCENIINNFVNAPSISFGGDRAFYRPSSDAVQMPKFEQFKDAESYYSVFFHELTHSTGHANRLKRDGVVKHDGFGSHQYSLEELVAEMGASYIGAIAGIQNSQILENSVAYIQNWINVLKNDVSLLMKAAGQAQKASDLILGTTFATAE